MSTVEDRPGLLGSILSWLRKGYPEGVPPKDYFPLLALLKKRLSDEDVDAVVADLVDSGLVPDRTSVHEAIERIAEQEPTDEDMALVAARLAAAGWPLAGLTESAGGDQVKGGSPDHPERGTVRPALLASIIDWLRLGYPQGVPAQDYVPLLALLRRRLSDEETVEVAREIVASGHAPAGAADIGVLISKVTNELPSDADVQRVREHLEAAGWPVAASPEGTGSS